MGNQEDVAYWRALGSHELTVACGQCDEIWEETSKKYCQNIGIIMLRVEQQVKTENQPEFWLRANCGHCPQAALVPGPLSLPGIYVNLPHAFLLNISTLDYFCLPRKTVWFNVTCGTYLLVYNTPSEQRANINTWAILNSLYRAPFINRMIPTV